MEGEMRILVPLPRETKRDRIAQDLAFGYHDSARWAVYNEEAKKQALKRADIIIKHLRGR